jgi:hypothetical protein
LLHGETERFRPVDQFNFEMAFSRRYSGYFAEMPALHRCLCRRRDRGRHFVFYGGEHQDAVVRFKYWGAYLANDQAPIPDRSIIRKKRIRPNDLTP